MNGASVRLSSEGLETLELDDWDGGWIATSLEVGAPQARSVAFDRPMSDGTIDRTALVGGRAVTIGLVLSETPNSLRQLLDRLGPFVHPGRRTTLELSTEYETRTLQVRSDGDVPVPWGPGSLNLTLGFVTVGSPYWIGALRSIVLSGASASGASGIVPPLTPPVLLPAGTPDESGVVYNSGSVDAHWVAEVLGPVTDIAIVNATTGKQIVLTGMTLADGQIAVIDTASRTVTVDGESRFAAVDAALSEWWLLPPGQSVLAIPSSYSQSPAQVWFRWSNTYYL